jgi:hypothetical protein
MATAANSDVKVENLMVVKLRVTEEYKATFCFWA